MVNNAGKDQRYHSVYNNENVPQIGLRFDRVNAVFSIIFHHFSYAWDSVEVQLLYRVLRMHWSGHTTHRPIIRRWTGNRFSQADRRIEIDVVSVGVRVKLLLMFRLIGQRCFHCSQKLFQGEVLRPGQVEHLHQHTRTQTAAIEYHVISLSL